MLRFKSGDFVELKSGNSRYKVVEELSNGRVVCTGYDGHSVCFSKENLKLVEDKKEDIFPIKGPELMVSLILIAAVFIGVLYLSFQADIGFTNFKNWLILTERTFALEETYAVSPGTIEIQTNGRASNKWKESDVVFEQSNGVQCTLENIRIKDNLDLGTGELYLYESRFYIGRYYLTDRNLGQKVEWL